MEETRTPDIETEEQSDTEIATMEHDFFELRDELWEIRKALLCMHTNASLLLERKKEECPDLDFRDYLTLKGIIRNCNCLVKALRYPPI